MGMTFAKHERIWLRQSPDFSESWLHDRISDDPSVLGLGELDVLERERVQRGDGRIDMLLTDSENNARFEVEIMLGATDPSHIVRCIEYWDIERRRYPAYDHVAVLVAENITSRFLNVMSLLAGSIPLVAIQLNALSRDFHFARRIRAFITPTRLSARQISSSHVASLPVEAALDVEPTRAPAFRASLRHRSTPMLFLRQADFVALRPGVSRPAPVAPRSSAACRRTAAGSDALLPAGASSTAHASPGGLRFSPAAAEDS